MPEGARRRFAGFDLNLDDRAGRRKRAVARFNVLEAQKFHFRPLARKWRYSAFSPGLVSLRGVRFLLLSQTACVSVVRRR